MKKKSTKHLTNAAILTAFGILIPIMMPAKIVIGPASFTLASHVPIFIAMMLSPQVALLVSLGTTLGFFIAGFPFIIVCRALSHLFFVVIGAIWLNSRPNQLKSRRGRLLLAIIINIIHGMTEFAFVYLISTSSSTSSIYVLNLLLLIGLGSFFHGLLDFYLAYYIVDLLQRRLGITILV